MLVRKSWTYLHDNFHKFSQDNKIKIALELAKKDMPDKNEHSGEINFNQMGTIKIDGLPFEVKLGN